MKKLTQGMAEHNKAMAAAKSDEAKDNIVSQLLVDGIISCSFLYHVAYKDIPHRMCRKLRNRILQLDCELAITFWQ